MFHQITIAGVLGQDPSMRYFPNGQAVTNISVAANHTYKNNDGETIRKTIWFRVAVYGKQAESVNQYLRKKSKVLVIGRLNADESGNPKIWTRQDGTSGASFEVTAESVKFLDSRENNGGEYQEGAQAEYVENAEQPYPF